METAHGALLVIGSGPGIGSNVARLFAERGFKKVILMSRNAERLEREVKFVKSTAPTANVEAVTVDLSDTDNVRAALAKVSDRLEDVPLECVLYNAARVGVTKILEWPAGKLESDLRIAVVSLYIAAQWALPQLLKIANDGSHSPSFLVTSGFLYKDPFPQSFSLATCKAGQYNLVHSLHKEFEPKGVHCGLIVVGGTVADESKVTNSRNIAEEAWKMFQAPKGEGELEVVLTDPDYQNHIKRRDGT